MTSHSDVHVQVNIYLNLPIISGGAHQYESLEQTRASFESSVGDLLEKLSQKITELCNLEKSTWLTVDLLSENCEKMLTQVDEYANEKV